MKRVLTALATLTLAGCADDYAQRSPTDPTPPTFPVTVYDSLSGKVIDENGICIVDAKVKVVSGQRAGQEITQRTPCNQWSYPGPEGEGFEFTELAPDGQMTLRASAKGYRSNELSVTPMSAQGQFVFIVLTQAQ